MKTSITDALKGILRRSDEIVAIAEDHERELSSLFSLKESNATTEICLELSDSIAKATADEIRSARHLIEACRDRVMAANSAISRRTTRNPLMMNAVQSGESVIFELLLAGGPEIITLAKIARPFKWVMRKVLTGVFSDIGQQLAKAGDNGPIRVELVRKERIPKGKGRGRHTPFMDMQVRVFREYLNTHPVCASYSVIDRARYCWMEHAEEWDRTARSRDGYSSYKALARAV